MSSAILVPSLCCAATGAPTAITATARTVTKSERAFMFRVSPAHLDVRRHALAARLSDGPSSRRRCVFSASCAGQIVEDGRRIGEGLLAAGQLALTPVIAAFYSPR